MSAFIQVTMNEHEAPSRHAVTKKHSSSEIRCWSKCHLQGLQWKIWGVGRDKMRSSARTAYIDAALLSNDTTALHDR